MGDPKKETENPIKNLTDKEFYVYAKMKMSEITLKYQNGECSPEKHTKTLDEICLENTRRGNLRASQEWNLIQAKKILKQV